MTPLELAADLEAKHKALTLVPIMSASGQWAAATLYGAFLDHLPTILASLRQSGEAIEELEAYRASVRIDVLMTGPKFSGCNVSQLKRAWEITTRALKHETTR